ncbi:hypothetical protein ONZ45_g7080 [Pleurotus djamor]|nr:hypothetical protein ONZ45_g7080 [Pleurotus djamor]
MQGRRIKGFSLLADYLAQIVGPKSSPMEFLLFLGDFIYADVPVYIGDTKEAYRRLYRRNYQSPDFRKVYESLPIFHAYDDHEIKNNFEGKSNDSSPPYPSASDAFKIYNSNANYHSHGSDEHYYEFRYADVAFFVMDTRRYRSGVNDTVETPTMLGEKQLTELFAWLGRVNSTATFKFIVTSVPFTSLWGHDAQVDSWAGYPAEKSALLKIIHTVPNVIFLSGDRHEFAAIEFNAEEGTLAPESLETVRRATEVPSSEDGAESTMVIEEVPQERVLKYLPSGNHKWSVFDLNTKNPDSPVLKIEVMIDGQPQYSHEIIGEPVVLPTGTAIGLLSSVQHLLGKWSTDPRKWF